MKSITKSPFVSQGLTTGSSPKAGDASVAGSAKSNIREIKIPPRTTELGKKHTAFDSLLDQLEADPENAEELAQAGQWVADTFFLDEGETIRVARLRKGLSQKQLAALIGSSQPHVANLERGLTDPLFSTVCKLCAALSIDPNSFQSMLDRQRSEAERKAKK